MNSNEILELVRAGYTKAEIEAMNGAPQEPTAPQESANGDYKQLTELVRNLTETVKAMQADNARRVSGEVPQKATAESAIKSFFENVPK